MSPSENRLVARLRAVLTEERLSVHGGSSMLHQLVTGTCGDIRSCLYTLQFASARARELAAQRKDDSSIVDISSTLKSALKGDGMKDARNDVAETVTAVFRKVKGTQSAARPETVTRVLRLVEVRFNGMDVTKEESMVSPVYFSRLCRDWVKTRKQLIVYSQILFKSRTLIQLWIAA